MNIELLSMKIINNFVLFSSLLALLMGIGQLLKPKSTKNSIVAIILLCLSWNQFWTFSGGYIRLFGVDLILPLLTVIITIAITSYLYFIILSQPEVEFQSKQYKLYLLLIPALVIDVLIIVSAPHIQSNTITRFFINIAHLIGGLSLIILFILGLIRLFSLMQFKSMTISGKFVFFISMYSIISIIIGLTGLAFPKTIISDIAAVLFACLLIFIFLVSYRYPALMSQFQEDIKKVRYQKSMLLGINKKELKEKLSNLMTNEEIYKYEECSLPFLANKMKLTSNQLSEFLNNDLGVSFSAYINKYRINKAKSLLIKNKDLTILDVAFEVGFGNKTSFNEAFLKLTGTTPLKYRKQFKVK